MKKKKQNETLLTTELYQLIINNVADEIIKLKNDQGEALNNIDIKRAVLEELKKQLRQLKKEIKKAKGNLKLEERKLRQINGNLSLRNTRLIDLSDEYSSPGESYINLEDYAFSNEQLLKKLDKNVIK